MTLDAETGPAASPSPTKAPQAVGSVFVRIGGSDILIELGTAELALHKIGTEADKPVTTLPDIAAVLREVADKLDGAGTVRPPEQPRGRHFAPYGSSEALCGESVGSAPEVDTGEYSDDRYTTKRARTSCIECLSRMDPTVSEDER